LSSGKQGDQIGRIQGILGDFCTKSFFREKNGKQPEKTNRQISTRKRAGQQFGRCLEGRWAISPQKASGRAGGKRERTGASARARFRLSYTY
jgi:hypothetical protein